MLRDPFRRRAALVLTWLASATLSTFQPSVNAAPFGPNSRENVQEKRVVRSFSASDLNRLERGIRLPVAGKYTIKIWSSPREHWSVEPQKEGAWPLGLKLEGTDAAPVWKTAGTIEVEKTDAPVRFVFDRGTRENRVPRPPC